MTSKIDFSEDEMQKFDRQIDFMGIATDIVELKVDVSTNSFGLDLKKIGSTIESQTGSQIQLRSTQSGGQIQLLST